MGHSPHQKPVAVQLHACCICIKFQVSFRQLITLLCFATRAEPFAICTAGVCGVIQRSLRQASQPCAASQPYLSWIWSSMPPGWMPRSKRGWSHLKS